MSVSVRTEIRCGPLSAVRVTPKAASTSSQSFTAQNPRPSPLVLVHGMFHGSWYFLPLQQLLAEEFGIESYAFDLDKWASRTASSYMDDLREAIADLQKDWVNEDNEGNRHRPSWTLFGHSQGGLFVQHLIHEMSNQQKDSSNTSNLTAPTAAIFCATYRIGNRGQALQMQKNIFVDDLSGSARLFKAMLLRGQVMRMPDAAFAKRCFLGEDTELIPKSWSQTKPDDDSDKMTVQEYYEILSQHGDGIPTHFEYGYLYPLSGRIPELRMDNLRGEGESSSFRSLAVSAEKDIIFGPENYPSMVQDFGSDLLSCSGQSHCLLDEGWEDSYARPLGRWLVASMTEND